MNDQLVMFLIPASMVCGFIFGATFRMFYKIPKLTAEAKARLSRTPYSDAFKIYVKESEVPGES